MHVNVPSRSSLFVKPKCLPDREIVFRTTGCSGAHPGWGGVGTPYDFNEVTLASKDTCNTLLQEVANARGWKKPVKAACYILSISYLQLQYYERLHNYKSKSKREHDLESTRPHCAVLVIPWRRFDEARTSVKHQITDLLLLRLREHSFHLTFNFHQTW